MTYWWASQPDNFKIALAWTIGHAAVYAIVVASTSGSGPLAIWAVTALADILPIPYVASLFIGSGRTPYDRITRTAVTWITR